MTTNRQNSKRNSFSYDFRARKKPISKMIKGLPVDYKDVDVLLSYVSDRAKISSAYRVGNDAKDHRSLTTAIKRARHMALLPISHEHELVRNFIQDSEEVKSEDSEEVKSEDSEEVKSEDSEEVKPEDSEEVKSEDSEEVKSEDSEEVKSEDSEEVKSEDSEEVKPENSDDDSSSKN